MTHTDAHEQFDCTERSVSDACHACASARDALSKALAEAGADTRTCRLILATEDVLARGVNTRVLPDVRQRLSAYFSVSDRPGQPVPDSIEMALVEYRTALIAIAQEVTVLKDRCESATLVIGRIRREAALDAERRGKLVSLAGSAPEIAESQLMLFVARNKARRAAASDLLSALEVRLVTGRRMHELMEAMRGGIEPVRRMKNRLGNVDEVARSAKNQPEVDRLSRAHNELDTWFLEARKLIREPLGTLTTRACQSGWKAALRLLEGNERFLCAEDFLRVRHGIAAARALASPPRAKRKAADLLPNLDHVTAVVRGAGVLLGPGEKTTSKPSE